jgi:hypothetical protein
LSSPRFLGRLGESAELAESRGYPVAIVDRRLCAESKTLVGDRFREGFGTADLIAAKQFWMS